MYMIITKKMWFIYLSPYRYLFIMYSLYVLALISPVNNKFRASENYYLLRSLKMCNSDKRENKITVNKPIYYF